MSQRDRSAILDCEEDEVTGPDVEPGNSPIATDNSYLVPRGSEWYNLADKWNVVRHFLCLRVAICIFKGWLLPQGMPVGA